MSLVAAKCTQCGAILDVDSSMEAAVCPHCRTPFITEKAINNYNTTNITNIGSIHADYVQLNDTHSIDNRVKSGDTFILLGEYEKARNVFDDLISECPYDYRGWFGMIKVISKDFNKIDVADYELNNIIDYYEKAKKVADEAAKETMNTYMESYVFNACVHALSVQTKEFSDYTISREQLNNIICYYRNAMENVHGSNVAKLQQMVEPYIMEMDSRLTTLGQNASANIKNRMQQHENTINNYNSEIKSLHKKQKDLKTSCMFIKYIYVIFAVAIAIIVPVKVDEGGFFFLVAILAGILGYLLFAILDSILASKKLKTIHSVESFESSINFENREFAEDMSKLNFLYNKATACNVKK